MKQVSQSLAGRLGILELSPFLSQEIPEKPVDDIWFYGGFPDGGVLSSELYLHWQNNYLTMMTQRDLPHWGLPARPQVTLKLLKMIAAVHGQNFNASQIGQALGLNYQTINTYMDYVTGCYIMRLLEPYSVNIKKRLVKAPKVYWRDSGLLHAVMKVKTLNELFECPWVGASWEGFVIEQIISHLQAHGKIFTPYYLRTSDQYEIDLVLDLGSELCAVEIKLTSCPSSKMTSRFNKAADLIKARHRIMISRTEDTIDGGFFISTNLTSAINILLALC